MSLDDVVRLPLELFGVFQTVRLTLLSGSMVLLGSDPVNSGVFPIFHVPSSPCVTAVQLFSHFQLSAANAMSSAYGTVL